jgi:hypothetical protein
MRIKHEKSGTGSVLFDLLEQAGDEDIAALSFLLAHRNKQLAERWSREIRYAIFLLQAELKPRQEMLSFKEFRPALVSERVRRLLIWNSVTTREELRDLDLWRVDWGGLGVVGMSELRCAQRLLRGEFYR